MNQLNVSRSQQGIFTDIEAAIEEAHFRYAETKVHHHVLQLRGAKMSVGMTNGKSVKPHRMYSTASDSNCKRWTDFEVEQLHYYYGKLTVTEMARVIKRSRSAISTKIHLEGLSGARK